MIARPFVKWVGGKRQIIGELVARKPASFNRYFEPFVGGGALFFELRPKQAFLSDSNLRLVRTYRAVRDDVESLIGLLSTYPYEKAFFERMREADVDYYASDVEVAAWFIYMNRAGFNGLYRVNANGKFNVAFGRYTNPTICDADNLRACSDALDGASIWHGDFENMCALPTAGDFVYLDPPYAPIAETSSFTKYSADGFTRVDQVRVRDASARMIERGTHVLISNSESYVVRDLYGAPPFAIEQVSATRAVNARADRRGPVTEVLIRGVSS